MAGWAAGSDPSRLRRWFQNIRKRQVKAPKVYLRDSGILHALLSAQPARTG